MRRHGWQRPLHPLQIVGIAVYCFLVSAFYSFLGLFLGNRVAEITVTTLFSFVVLSVMLLFIRCTAIDPTDRTRFRKKKKSKSNKLPKLNYGSMLGLVIVRFFRKMERKILRTFIRRKYLDPWKTGPQIEPLLPFPLVMKDDAIAPDQKEDEISFCSLCDFQVKKHSKHCRTCNRCVEGFDHHCRWLNNCIGKKNYTTFFLLMIFVLLMLVMEGGTAIAIFIRCFTNKRGIEMELRRKLHADFPREALATISILLVLMTAYGSAALGQLFFFHVVLIKKGMRTYDYILAMKEANKSMELDPFDDSDLSSDEESSDSDTPDKSTSGSRLLCSRARENQNPTRLSIRIDDPQPSTVNKQGLHISINPWKLISMSREKALAAAEKARERLRNLKPELKPEQIKPLPLEKKSGPLKNPSDMSTPVGPKGRIPGSPGSFSSPRRRFSGSQSMLSGSAASPKQKYRNSFDLRQLTEVSRELETYISRQVLCSVIKKEGSEASPR